MSPDQRQRAALQACQKIIDANYLELGQHLALYCATAAELDPAPVLEAAARLKKSCYLPRVTRGSKGAMEFVAYSEGDPLLANGWGIPEPLDSAARIDPQALDLVIVPLLGFDASCNRLGMGGGFYDRAFEFRKIPGKRKPLLVGLAFECQQSDEIEVMPWDVGMDIVVTEQELRVAVG